MAKDAASLQAAGPLPQSVNVVFEPRRKGQVIAIELQPSPAVPATRPRSSEDPTSRRALLRRVKVAWWVVGAAPLLLAFLWAYWPTLEFIVSTWETDPDYSHGYLVLPLALVFLWVRRDRFPGIAGSPAWLGLALIAASILVRYVAGRWFLPTVEPWSILLWVAGVVWLLFGRAILWWSLPSILFLGFAMPLPFRIEQALSVPLQRIATKLGCWGLQCLAHPAFSIGNVIYLGGHELKVAEACSGLRIFYGVIALAFAYCVLLRRSWWEKAIVVAGTIPIALVANCARIVVTGLLYVHVSSEAGQKFSHDLAGWLMIAFATGLFALWAWYLAKLLTEVERVDPADVLRKGRGTASSLGTKRRIG